MGNKKVASTIMLHLENGTKKFLVYSNEQSLEFVTTTVDEMQTGLANALRKLKNSVHVDVNNINLVELTNTHIADESVPLFVFEADEASLVEELPAGYIWEDSAHLQRLLTEYQIDGVPYF